ncbi:hypothetical protein [Lysobacter capsici]|uniref:hypothetical protein n=1 Tax=Lysobacter capsici TaxID=435897 RepID=UPI001C004292|nr:hypothetical protein [Lysobacter capsici]QWF17456.1 hypothetical protein KME82_01225 [Lysobacter capsici]
MHDYRSYRENLTLASLWYSQAIEISKLSAISGLSFCLDAMEPDRVEDPLVQRLLYAAILRTAVRYGASLRGTSPDSLELRDTVLPLFANLDEARLLAMGACPQEIAALLKDLDLILREHQA